MRAVSGPRRRFAIVWLDTALGLSLLASAMGARLTPLLPVGGDPRVADAVSAGFIAFAAVLLGSHALIRWPRARAVLIWLAAAVALIAPIRLLRFGFIDLILLDVMLAASLVLSGRYVWKGWDVIRADETARRSPLVPIAGWFAVAYGAACAVPGLGAEALLARFGAPAPLVAVAFAAVGAGLLAETRGKLVAWGAVAAIASGSAMFVVLALARAGSGSPVAAMTYLALAIMLPLSRWYPLRNMVADDLAGLTESQRSTYGYERVGELGIWLVIFFGAFYTQLVPPVSFRTYFISVVLAVVVTQVSFRLLPVRSIGPRHYMWTLLAVAVSYLLLLAATGGLSSPFVYFAFVAIFAGAVVIPPSWLWYPVGLIALYFGAEIARTVSADGPWHRPDMLQGLFMLSALGVTGLYATLISRKHAAHQASIEAANVRMNDLLRQADAERARAEASAKEQRTLNLELLEMRSALMNVLEDVEETKRQIESDFLRDAAIFEALGEAVAAADKNGRIFLFNPAAETLTGVPRTAAVGKPLESIVRFFFEEGRVLQTDAITQAYAGRGGRLLPKLTIASPDGRRTPVSGTVAPFFDAERRLQGIVVAFRDMTVERDIDRQKSGFISIASHQLRTPLSSIRWFVDLLLGGDAGKLNAEQQEFLKDIYASVTRMISLVGDLLDVSRIEEGRVLVNPVPTEVGPIVETLIKDFAGPLAAKKLTIEQDVAKTIPPAVVDPDGLRQALGNLVSNAINYTPEGGRVGIRAAADGPAVVVEVWDTGIGIPESQKHRVYERFFRAANAVSRETVGSGLGLYITRLLVEASGGTIGFTSEEGKGTRFTLRLPIKKA